jgi:hypothetical protein
MAQAKTTEDFGLRIFMRDFNMLGQGGAKGK